MAAVRRSGWWAACGPGLLVAATGVGAGDLATGAFSGRELGVAVLWAVWVGALLKFVLTEGLARWQIATGETLLEGALRRLPRLLRWSFLLYLLPWTWFVGSALISACGVASHALLPVFADAADAKVWFGILCSLLGLVLVERGGFALFEKVMRVCIGLMFVTTLLTAAWIAEDWGAIAAGLVLPRVPAAGGQGLDWTLALIGGVGGTLTVLCYGYWIREVGRDRPADLPTCRVDLGIGYLVTALFGIAIVILGDQLPVAGSGANLVVALGERLGDSLGPWARWAFLLGAFGAVFSSLLGVWQSVPYVFADFWQIARHDRTGPVDTRGTPYRAYLYGIALVPMGGLAFAFQDVQQAYAILGAAFLPLLALSLLWLNGGAGPVPPALRNRPWTTLALAASMVFYGWFELRRRLG